jgi:polar amino acid transport system permease protein
MTDHDKGAGSTSAPSGVRPVDGATRRQLWLRRQRRRATVLATASTALVTLVTWYGVTHASGWPRVKRLFFNGNRFRTDLPDLVHYFWIDVKIFLVCVPFILVWALVLATWRNTRNPLLFPLRLFAAAYTDIFRGVPIILTIYLVGFGIPALRLLHGSFRFLGLGGDWASPYLWGPVALILSYSAYVAEVLRAGIEGVHESQRAGARSLGLSHGQTMRFVVLPQAGRRVVPALMNDFLSLQKDVSLISFLGVIEVFRKAQAIKDFKANYTPYVAAAVIFLLLTIPETRLVDWYSARQRRRTGGSVIA